MGGALIVLGEDYGEGASVIQERSHAFALKSSLWLLDPRPNLPTIVRLVERAFELSEASNTPVMMELRIRTCHVHGAFETKTNRTPARLAQEPARRTPGVRIRSSRASTCDLQAGEAQARGALARGEEVHPRATFERALWTGRRRCRHHRSRRPVQHAHPRVGRVRPRGSFRRNRGAATGLNVVHPLVPEEITGFCAGRTRVLVMEEGQPEYIEQEIATILRRAELMAAGSAFPSPLSRTSLHGKDLMPMGGEYNAEAMLRGLSEFFSRMARAIKLRL